MIPWMPCPCAADRAFLLIPLWNWGILKDERRTILDVVRNKPSIGKDGYVATKRKSQ